MGLPHHQCLIVVAHVLLFSVLCGPKAQWVGLLKTKSKHKGQKKILGITKQLIRFDIKVYNPIPKFGNNLQVHTSKPITYVHMYVYIKSQIFFWGPRYS